MTCIKIYVISIIVLTGAVIAGCKKSNNGSGGQQTGKKVVVSTIAGDGGDGYVNGPALSARFQEPSDVAVATDGTIYVADYLNNRIRKISNGQVTTLAGDGTRGIKDDQGEMAKFQDPISVAVDATGNVYVVDHTNPRIRKISTTSYVSTFAGTDQPGFLNGGSLMAQFAINALGIATDLQGNVYLDDTFNGRIRKINPVSSQVSTWAGTGGEGLVNGDTSIAQFRYSIGIAVDNQGNLFVADAGNFCIRKVSATGVVSTFAGGGVKGLKDGSANEAQFSYMNDIVADNHGNVFVTDENTVRMITPQGVVSTIAGSSAGYADGDGAIAKFKTPFGLGVDGQGNIYVADANNNRIRKISFQ